MEYCWDEIVAKGEIFNFEGFLTFFIWRSRSFFGVRIAE